MRLLNYVIIVVAAGLLVVNFTVSQWTTTPGWNFTNITSSCGPTFLRATPGVTGVIYSPNYPNHYPNSEACIWSISTSDSYVIEVTVVDLRMESCFNCSCDFVAIYDGIQSNATLLKNLCNFSPGKIHSTGKIMRVEFVADSIGTNFGFQLNFTAVPVTPLLSTLSLLSSTTPTTRWPPSTTASAAACNSNVVILHAALNSKEKIYSPGYPYNYPPHTTCQWRISADQGNVIYLVVLEASIENCSSCTCDKVIMYDGPSSNASELYRLCTTIKPNHYVYGTRQDMFITFTSDSSGSGRGFVLEYWGVFESVGIYLQASTNQTKYIYSPKYPMRYPNYADRRWQIRADDGYVVQLSVLDVHIEHCTNCSCDQLQIFDAPAYTQGRRIRQYCDTLRSDVVYTTQQYAFLIFTADSTDNGKGFVITYRAVTYDPAFYQTTEGSTTYYKVYQRTDGSATYSKDQTTSLVMIIVGCLTGLSILVILVVLILFLVKRCQARVLNTYSNLPHTGNTVTVTSTTVPAMHYYQPNGGVVVAGPGVVYPAQSAPPAIINEAFTPDLVPTSHQSLPPQTGQ